MWATFDFAPCSRSVGDPPTWWGLCNQSSHLWATSIFVPLSEVLRTLQDSRGHVASPSTCWPLLILVHSFEGLGTPETVGVMWPIRQVVGRFSFCHLFKASATPQTAAVM